MRQLLLVIAIIMAISTANATVINIPDDYSTIQEGIDMSSNGDTVLVQSGTYYENLEVYAKDIVLASLFLISNDSSYIESTVIDGSDSGSVVMIYDVESENLAIVGFTITNGYTDHGGGIYVDNADPLIMANHITLNAAFGFDGGGGGGIYCLGSNAQIIGNIIELNSSDGPLIGEGGGIYCAGLAPLIKGNIITDNIASHGGGLYFESSNPTMVHNVVVDNRGNFGGGGLYSSNSMVTIKNCTFTENETDWSMGGAIYFDGAYLNAQNSIFYYNEALEGSGEIEIIGGSADVTYCDVEGGFGGEGNMDDGPFFRDPENGDYHLMAIDCGDQYDSPLIDMGNPDILDEMLDCEFGLGLLFSDMGAYGGCDSVSISIDDIDEVLPVKTVLKQNYPNPFNAQTTISFTLEKPQHIRLEIYDILGRKVSTLADEQLPAGNHHLNWQADTLTSGIYFARLETTGNVSQLKMSLLK